MNNIFNNTYQNSLSKLFKNITMKTRTVNEEIQAQTIIINIQMMQEKCYGDKFAYSDFNGNTLAELYDLQDKMIVEYNNTFKI